MQTPIVIYGITSTSLLWFAVGATIAAPPIGEMNPRDAVAVVARPSEKTYAAKDIADIRSMHSYDERLGRRGYRLVRSSVSQRVS